VSTIAGSPGISGSADGTGASAQFSQLYGIAVNGAGILYVADYLSYSMREAQLAAVLQYSAFGQQLVLSWPLGLTGFLPQVATSLPAVLWTPLPTNAMSTPVRIGF
jgi:hypothetical protein